MSILNIVFGIHKQNIDQGHNYHPLKEREFSVEMETNFQSHSEDTRIISLRKWTVVIIQQQVCYNQPSHRSKVQQNSRFM